VGCIAKGADTANRLTRDEARRHEAAEGLFWRANDWSATHVEAGIDRHRAASQRVEALDQVVIKGVGLAVHGLHACRIVDMGDRRNRRANDVELVDPNSASSAAVIDRLCWPAMSATRSI
jgi:hypothetical protein